MLEFPSSSHETSVHDEVGNNKYVIELDTDEYGWTRYVSLDPQVHFSQTLPLMSKWYITSDKGLCFPVTR